MPKSNRVKRREWRGKQISGVIVKKEPKSRNISAILEKQLKKASADVRQSFSKGIFDAQNIKQWVHMQREIPIEKRADILAFVHNFTLTPRPARDRIVLRGHYRAPTRAEIRKVFPYLRNPKIVRKKH